MSRVSVDQSGFLNIDGRKMPVKVTPAGKLEFCDKSAAYRHNNARYVTISPSELTEGVREITGTNRPERIETA